jgi:hypothetical protein
MICGTCEIFLIQRRGFAFSTRWCPRPDLNRNLRFRKPLLYPVELRGLDVASTEGVEKASRRGGGNAAAMSRRAFCPSKNIRRYYGLPPNDGQAVSPLPTNRRARAPCSLTAPLHVHSTRSSLGDDASHNLRPFYVHLDCDRAPLCLFLRAVSQEGGAITHRGMSVSRR